MKRLTKRVELSVLNLICYFVDVDVIYKLGLPKNGRHSAEAIEVFPAVDNPHGDVAQSHVDIAQIDGEIAQIDGEIAQVHAEIAQVHADVAQVNGNIAQLDLADGVVERDDTVIVEGKFYFQ